MPVTRRNAGTIRMSMPVIIAPTLTEVPGAYGPDSRWRMSLSASGQKWSIMTSAKIK